MDSFNKARIAVGSCCLMMAGVSALAQTGVEESEPVSRPWMLGIAAQLDDLDTDSLYATFNWGVTEKTWIYVSGGTSRFKNNFGELTTDSFLAGFDRQFGRFGFSLDGEVWGDSAEIDSTDVRATVHFGGDRYRFYLELEDRRIDLSPVLPNRPVLSELINLDVDGTGIGARLRVNLTDNWRLYLRGMSYDYEWSSPTLQRQDSLTDVCANTASLVDACDQLRNFLTLLERRNLYVQSTLANNSFLDSELSLIVEWQLGTKLLNLNLTRDRAIDVARSESQSVGASILFPISYRMDLEFSLGRSESDLFEPSIYGGVFFLLYGG